MAGTPVVIYVPAGRGQQAKERRCCRDAASRGERVVAVVPPLGWRDAEAMIEAGSAERIVVDRWEDVPQEALPHVRVINPAGRPAPRQRTASADDQAG